MRLRTIVYIDGFNLYYGAVRGTPYKWLNLEKYFSIIRPHDDLIAIKYFTAEIVGPTRKNQEAFLNALSTLPLIKIILGKFKQKRLKCEVAPACLVADASRFFFKAEEKRTDVNIAVSMIDDAYRNECDQFVVVSGDSDLVPAVRMVRERFPLKKITVYIPAGEDIIRGKAYELRSAAHKGRLLPLNVLPLAQFPAQVPAGAGGFYSKPVTW